MDATAMIRRANERGAKLETYDPNHLVGDVQDLLRERGLDPDLPPDTGRAAMATSAAGMLLRAFGISPAPTTPPSTDSTHPTPTSADRRALAGSHRDWAGIRDHPAHTGGPRPGRRHRWQGPPRPAPPPLGGHVPGAVQMATRPRQPAEGRSSTAHTRDTQLVSPGEPADDLGPAAGLAEGAIDQVE
jgi:hypothetical protein